MARATTFLCKFILMCCLLLPIGCAKNNPISLGYSAGDGNPVTAPVPAKICVVMFDDARVSTDLGLRSNNTPYIAKSSVPEWVSKAMADELIQRGYVVTWLPSLAQARSSGVDYIVTGKVTELWLSDVSTMSLRCVMQISVKVEGKTSVVLQEALSSTVSRTVFPMTNPIEEMLASSLQDILKPLALKISQKIH